MNFSHIFSLAVILDAALGDPKFSLHPVRLIGKLIASLEKRFYTGPHDFSRGLVLCIAALTLTGLTVWGLLYLTNYSALTQVLLLYAALAWRDLRDETAPVLCALVKQDIAGARKFLSFVVGRDTQNLSEREITSAVIETVAENCIDGVMSPMFWALVGNFVNPDWGAYVLIWAFKAASTLDSMIGYESFHEFGKSSARLDDFMNFIPARLGGIMILLAGHDSQAVKIFMNYRLSHKSPNSAHGESAFAGVLNVKLGGGAYYSGKFEHRPFINESASEPEPCDIVRAWHLLDKSCALSALMVILLSWIIT